MWRLDEKPYSAALRGAAIGLAMLATLGSTRAYAQGVGYELSGSANYIRWDEALGLEDTYLYGGKIGFTFGPRVSLQPFYFTRSNVEADPATIEDGGPFAQLARRELDLQHFGANVQFNLGRGDFVPFVRAGGGVLRIEPDGGDRSDQITLQAGGGLRFGLGGLQAEFFAEDLALRLNRFRLYAPATGGGTLPSDPESDDLRHNLVLGAGLTVPISGYGEVSEAAGLRGAAIPLEPFGGQLQFDNDLDLDDQNLIGVRTGLDLNAFFGIRGYYWRGVNDDLDETDPVQSYGGEAQFNLNTGPGISPYLVAGAGRIDYDEDELEGSQAALQRDRMALILGGGLSFGLSERARINVAGRDYIFDQNEEFEDVRSTDDLLHNLLLSAGLTFSIGGRTPTAERMDTEETRRLRAETERLRRENERLREGRRAGERSMARVDTVMMTNERGERVVREIIRTEEGGERMITVPVPDEGEIILRYGPGREVRVGPGGERISGEEIREVIRDEMARGQTGRGQGVTDQELAELERRLADRIDEIVARRMGGQQPQQPGQPNVVVVPQQQQGIDPAVLDRLNVIERRLSERIDAIVEQRVREEMDRRAAETPVVTVVEGDTVITAQPSLLDRLGRIDVDQVRPYVGPGFDPTQLVIGARADLGPITPNSRFDFVPELAFGVGGDEFTLLAVGNLRYGLGTLGGRYDISPYLIGGAGIFSESFLALNLGYGASFDVRGGVGAPLRLFIEHQGINLFDRNRFLVGVNLEPR